MSDPGTRHDYQERFLDGFDRSELRREVRKVKPRRLSGLKKKYAGWALGASLALGGLGVPLKMMEQFSAQPAPQAPAVATGSLNAPLQDDVQAAHSIAQQVADGVSAAAKGVESATQSPLATVAQAPVAIAQTVVGAPKAVASTAEQLKEQFFQREVPFGSIIYSEARKNNIAPELVAAVVHAESNFVPTARSARGAIGLMQMIPKTGQWMGARDLTNPSQNISAGARYLRYLSDRFDGDEAKTIAAFNAGEGNVRRFNGIPPFRETQAYVQQVQGFQRDLGTQVSGDAAAAQASAHAAIQIADAR